VESWQHRNTIDWGGKNYRWYGERTNLALSDESSVLVSSGGKSDCRSPAADMEADLVWPLRVPSLMFNKAALQYKVPSQQWRFYLLHTTNNIKWKTRAESLHFTHAK